MWKVKWMHFPAHVYRSPSVQWTVCMKANVLIYKWVTLGKTWRCGAFSFRDNSSPGSWPSSSPSLRPTVPRTLLRGQLGHVKVKVKFLMICLVSCGTFRITPFRLLLTHWSDWAPSRRWTLIGTQGLWKREEAKGLSAKAHCICWEREAFSSVEEFFSTIPREHWALLVSLQ